MNNADLIAFMALLDSSPSSEDAGKVTESQLRANAIIQSHDPFIRAMNEAMKEPEA